MNRMDVDSTMSIVAEARQDEVDWNALGLHDWFPYEYKSGKLCRVTGSDPMVRKLADATEYRVAGTDLVITINRKEFAKGGMSSKFVEAPWLQYLEKKVEYFDVPSLGAHARCW